MRTGKTNFETHAPPGATVAIAGSFNDWAPTLMREVSPGGFAIALQLRPGRYEYKFVVDGAWLADVENEEWCLNEFGSLNSVCEVREIEHLRREHPVLFTVNQGIANEATQLAG
ncbi:MAG: 1,4-alpha-glucan branching enzyme [Rhodothermales bacterium]|jgi:1,4-alpha-glucan branching enzyme